MARSCNAHAAILEEIDDSDGARSSTPGWDDRDRGAGAPPCVAGRGRKHRSVAADDVRNQDLADAVAGEVDRNGQSGTIIGERSCAHAEQVPLWVGQDHVLGALGVVPLDSPRAKSDETLNL